MRVNGRGTSEENSEHYFAYFERRKEYVFTFDRHTALVNQRMFDDIADYSRSMPTGATPGRLYKKNSEWDYVRKGVEPCWWVFYCIRDPEDEKYVLHIPRRLLVV